MQYSREVYDRIKRWHHDPMHFVMDSIDVEPSNQQMEGLAAFRDGATKGRKISIRSGHGTGKDAFASWIILWFMSTRKDAKIACTAPTARQLHDILWSELGKWLKRSKVQDEFIKQKQKLFHKLNSDTWWVRLISPGVSGSPDEQAETLAGLHGDHFLIIADEASGIPDPTYITLEGALTQEDNWCLLIGNMTKNSGYFYDTHFNTLINPDWQRLHWDSRDSSNVKKTYVDYMRLKYGEDSNVFRIRVVGDPPREDEKTFIPLAWAIDCVGNEIVVPEVEPIYLGVDVARYGDDYSIILPREGNKVIPWDSYQGMNTIDLAAQVCQTHADLEADGVAVDEIGVGSGVVDWLQKKNFPGLFPVNVANSSSDMSKYHRLRDELWYRVREKCMNRQYSFPDKLNADGIPMGHELANELSSPWYEFNEHGGYKIEAKKKMKARGIASPNIADALCLTEMFSSIAYRIWPKGEGRFGRKRKKKPWEKDEGLGGNAWMVR